jgi:hypothetical protein
MDIENFRDLAQAAGFALGVGAKAFSSFVGQATSAVNSENPGVLKSGSIITKFLTYKVILASGIFLFLFGVFFIPVSEKSLDIEGNWKTLDDSHLYIYQNGNSFIYKVTGKTYTVIADGHIVGNALVVSFTTHTGGKAEIGSCYGIPSRVDGKKIHEIKFECIESNNASVYPSSFQRQY